MMDTSPPTKVLVTDDDVLARNAMRHSLERGGYEVLEAADGQSALAKMDAQVGAILLDLDMPIMNGIECLRAIQREYDQVPVIIISGQDRVDVAVDAMKAGAHDYITKPFKLNELPDLVDRQIKRASFQATMPQPAFSSDLLSGDDPFAARIDPETLERLMQFAELNSTILLTGESGTGKSTLAKLIHKQSHRAAGPLVTVNCASLPRELIESELFGHVKGAFTGALSDRLGRIEMANGGTLFMDEIGDLPIDLQPKLLTFLQDRVIQRIGCNQERRVDVRVIAATHQDLVGLCEEKKFRQDLFFRLNVLHLQAAPLRHRIDELDELTRIVLKRIATARETDDFQISDEALAKLRGYHWPGNIRELENALERATAYCLGGEIQEQHIEFSSSIGNPVAPPQPETPKQGKSLTLAEIERVALAEALEQNKGNRAQTARQLGISEKGLYNKLKRHGLFTST